jgi:Leucine-rich repeat (LRR) protein
MFDIFLFFSVSGSKIKRLDAETLRKLPRLTRLNLSNNSLQRFPPDVVLENLRHLDVRDNCLVSFEFLQQMEKLEELWLESNGCEVINAADI